MTDALDADFVDSRRVRSRKVLQLVLEIPLEREPDVHRVIGYPNPESGCPVAIARLQDGYKAPSHGGERARQAGRLCSDLMFRKWLQRRGHHVADADEAAEAVRSECNVESRRELDHDDDAGKRWDRLYREYRVWAGWDAEPR